MARLEVDVLGGVQVRLDGESLSGFRSAKVRALLLLLVMEPERTYQREALMDWLWPELPAEKASENLRQSFSRLQKKLKNQQANPPFLKITRDAIRWNPESETKVDAFAFLQLLSSCAEHQQERQASCGQCVAFAKQALGLYHGECLAYFFVEGSPTFEDWAQRWKDRIQQALLGALDCLAEAAEGAAQYEESLSYTQQRLAVDALHEDTHRQQMRLLWRLGRREAALQQFVACESLLLEELGLGLEPETVALAQRIREAKPQRSCEVRQRKLGFVGRGQELAQLHRMIRPQERRLCSVVGTGGIGKSTLVNEFARALADDPMEPFIDGIFVISVEEAHDLTALCYMMASSLRFSFYGSDALEEQLFDEMKDLECLWVLDGVEHLLPEFAGFCQRLLQRVTTVKILSTSRQRLGLRDESLLWLEGLPYPQLSTDPTTDASIEDSHEHLASVALFLQIAAQQGTGFAWAGLTADERQALLRLCALLEGMPLGIEMAAAWTSMMSCVEILEALKDSLELLETHDHDVPTRHRSVYAIFQSTWEWLSEKERTVLQRLCLFRGSFSGVAAKEVVQASPWHLRGLLQKSLIQHPKPGRYRLHRLLLMFIREQATYSPTPEEQQRYRHFYTSKLAQEREPLTGKGQADALVRIYEDIENIRKAWGVAVELQDWEALRRAGQTLYLFYSLRSWFVEGEEMLTMAFDALFETDQSARANPDLTVLLASRLGEFSYALGKLPEARRYCTVAIDHLPLEERPIEAFPCLRTLGLIDSLEGHYEAAAHSLFESLSFLPQEGYSLERAHVWLSLGSLFMAQGELEEAHKALHKSLVRYQSASFLWGVAHAFRLLGRVSVLAHDLESAESYLQDSLSLYEAIEYKLGIALASSALGELALLRGDMAQAQKLCQQGVDLGERCQSMLAVCVAKSHLGRVFLQQGEYHTALPLLFDAVQGATERGFLPVVLDSCVTVAECLLATPQHQEAVALLSAVTAHNASSFHAKERAQALLSSGVLEADDMGNRPALALPEGKDLSPQRLLDVLRTV